MIPNSETLKFRFLFLFFGVQHEDYFGLQWDPYYQKKKLLEYLIKHDLYHPLDIREELHDVFSAETPLYVLDFL